MTPNAARWFVYYRVAEADAPACIAAAQALQQRLRAQHPALHAELLRRPGAAGPLTLMETYAGLDHDRLAEVEALCQATLGRWIDGARHCELFVPCAS